MRIPLATAQSIGAFADSQGYELSTTIGESTYVRRRSGGEVGWIGNGRFVRESNLAGITSAPTSIHAVGHETVAALLEAFGGGQSDKVAFGTFSRGAEFDSLIITNPKANKGWALRELCRWLDVPASQALAIGDSEPDIDMFAIAGVSVAVGDSAPKVLSMADHVGPPQHDSAVARALRSFAL